LPLVCRCQGQSLSQTIAEFLKVTAVIVHYGEDRLAERTTLVSCPGHPHQISERKVVAAQSVYRADQAKAPLAVAQLASVPLPAVVEETLETDQHLESTVDLFCRSSLLRHSIEWHRKRLIAYLLSKA
jgi:hypothetical protein